MKKVSIILTAIACAVGINAHAQSLKIVNNTCQSIDVILLAHDCNTSCGAFQSNTISGLSGGGGNQIFTDLTIVNAYDAMTCTSGHMGALGWVGSPIPCADISCSPSTWDWDGVNIVISGSSLNIKNPSSCFGSGPTSAQIICGMTQTTAHASWSSVLGGYEVEIH